MNDAIDILCFQLCIHIDVLLVEHSQVGSAET